VRERGVQSRRVRPGHVEPVRRPGPPPRPSGGNFWQALAIVALIAATAGWTTVAVLALRPAPPAEAEVPVESLDPLASDDAEVPPVVADTHDAVELESLLPATLSGTALQVQSWDGDGLLTDDPWSMSMTAFLAALCKVPADLHVAQSYDPNMAVDASIGVYKADGVDPTALRDALIAAWKGDYPDMKVSQVNVGGKDVTKGDFGEDGITSYLYIRDEVVYDIESADETIATTALEGLPGPGGPAAPTASGSAAPAASCVPPSASPDASPSAS
jgi:hypothetical protein